MDRIGDLKMAMDNGDLDIDLLFPMMMVDSVVGVVGKMMTVMLIGCGIKNFDLFEVHQDVDDIVGHLWMTHLWMLMIQYVEEVRDVDHASRRKTN